MNQFFSQPRFKSTKRTYTASDVASKQGSLPLLPHKSNLLADKLHAILTNAAGEGKPVLTMGGTDDADGETSGGGVCFRVGVFEYVGNGECWILGVFSVLSVFGGVGVLTLGRTGRDCPYTTVPNQGHRIFRAQQVHDKKHYAHGYREQREKMEYVDDLRPIIAYADTGRGGLSIISRHGVDETLRRVGRIRCPLRTLTTRWQKVGPPLLVPTSTHTSRFRPPRIYHAHHRPHRRRVGQTHLFDAVEAAIKESTIKDKQGAIKTFKDATVAKPISDMREIVKEILGAPVFWDHEMPRTREGYYHVTGGLGVSFRFVSFTSCISTSFCPRSLRLRERPHSHHTPDIEEARYFARKIRETYPETFDWSAHGFSGKKPKAPLLVVVLTYRLRNVLEELLLGVG
ncbi:mitochondrial 2-methylisocitrate lyase [Marasmius sp. AFHP31]|nr:mitochondrial 2-methylisocitrate lyase [Marasmius sp. AFHP31]